MKKIRQNHLIFILIILFGGIIVGMSGSSFLELDMLNQLDLILLPMNESFDIYKVFISQFTLHILYITVITILSTSLIGTFLIALALFTKGFQIGLTCMMFIYTYQMKGLLGIILTLLPQMILEMIPIVLISIFAIQCSNHVLYTCLNTNKFKLTSELNQGLNYLIITIISALASSYLKATLIIMLIRFFNSF